MKNLSTMTLVLAIAVAPCALAQNAYIGATTNGSYTQAAPAPIERPGQEQGVAPQVPPPHDVMATHPAKGVTVRADSGTEVQTVSADDQRTELRLERGVANVMVHNPMPDMLLLVDLPGGQVQLLKDGFYTFNAQSNTARVFDGEADAFAANREKPMHVKGGDQIVFTGGNARVSYADPYNAQADVLAAPMQQGGQGYGGQAYGGEAYGDSGYAFAGPVDDGFYGGYGDGFYGDYPYYAYGYPYGYGYPGFGYGLGFGYGWGGYYGGGYGYRGGYYGGHFGSGHFPAGGGYPHPGNVGGGFHGGGGGGFDGGGGGGHR